MFAMSICYECGCDVVDDSSLSLNYQGDESGLAYFVQASSDRICRRCFAEALLASLSVTVLVKAEEEEPVAA
jgi:hypothetical protein